MSWFVSDEPVAVELGECRCPGTPHSTDTVWLRSTPSMASGVIATQIMYEANPDTMPEKLGRAYLEYNVTGWSFLDEKGEPVPVSRDLIRHLSWDALFPLAEKAAELYSEALTRPLVARASKSSPNGHTARSTSAKRRSSSVRPKP